MRGMRKAVAQRGSPRPGLGTSRRCQDMTLDALLLQQRTQADMLLRSSLKQQAAAPQKKRLKEEAPTAAASESGATEDDDAAADSEDEQQDYERRARTRYCIATRGIYTKLAAMLAATLLH